MYLIIEFNGDNEPVRIAEFGDGPEIMLVVHSREDGKK